MTTVKQFTDKNNASSFTSGKENQIYSEAIEQSSVSLNSEGFPVEEKLIYFIKSEKPELVKQMIPLVMNQIKSGSKKLYRVFSTSPFYVGQSSDVNPSTGVVLNRFSKVKFGSVEEADRLHRTFVETHVAQQVVAPTSYPVTQADPVVTNVIEESLI